MTSIVGSTIFSSRSAALGLDARTAALMDSIYAIGFGLGLRFVVDVVSQHSLKTTGVLVGLWEGIVLLHFLQKMPKSFDPYVGFGVRMFVDFLVTESVARMVVVSLWTGLGMILADIAPSIWRDTGMKRAWSLFRRELYVLLQSIPQVDVPIPFWYKQRTVRFSPSRTSSVVSAASAATSATSPTTAVSPTVASTSAQTRAPTGPSASLPARAATPAPPPSVPKTQPPQTPGTALRKRLPGHFARDSETETDFNSTAGRPRIPSTETESESGLTTDNDALGTSRGSRYSLFVPRQTDLRLTESDTDDTSSTTTETPDAGTLRDISEAEVATPTLHPTLLPMLKESMEVPIVDETVPKTPLPPPDQVPEIPDTLENGLDESWEKIEMEDSKPAEDKPDDDDKDSLIIPPPVPPKWTEPLVSADKEEKEKTISEPVPVLKSEKVEKAMSEPPWGDKVLIKKKGNGKGKAKSVLSSVSAVDWFFKPGEPDRTKAAGEKEEPSSAEEPPAPASTPAGPSQPASTPAGPSQPASPPAGNLGDTTITTPAKPDTDKLIDLDNKSIAGIINNAADTRTPPPTFSQIYPEGVPLPPSVAPTAPASTIAVVLDADASPTATGTPAEPEPTTTTTPPAAAEEESNDKPTTSTSDSAPPLESETESDVNSKELPAAKQLSGALELLGEIKVLEKELVEIKRQQVSAELDGEDGKELAEKKKMEAEEVEKRKAKLERKVRRRYCASYDEKTDSTTLDVSSFTSKPATEAILERILKLLASDATELEVTVATTLKAAKMQKARSLRTSLAKALKEHNIAAEEDFSPKLLRVTLPARPKLSSPAS